MFRWKSNKNNSKLQEMTGKLTFDKNTGLNSYEEYKDFGEI